MDLVRRRAGSLLALGLAALLGWTTVVAFAMPNWFDGTEDCAVTFGMPDSSVVRVDSHVFPPRATCDFGGGDVRAFISPTETTLLSIAFVLILGAVLVGLFFTTRRVFEDDEVIRSAEAVDLGGRRTAHLASGLVVFAVAFGIYTTVNALLIVLGGLVGGIASTFAALVVLASLGAGLDRQVGPLPTTAMRSRRRGAAAGLITFAVVFAATGLAGKLPFPRLWSVPLGGITYVVVILWQWNSHRTDRGPVDGDTIEQDLLGGPRA